MGLRNQKFSYNTYHMVLVYCVCFEPLTVSPAPLGSSLNKTLLRCILPYCQWVKWVQWEGEEHKRVPKMVSMTTRGNSLPSFLESQSIPNVVSDGEQLCHHTEIFHALPLLLLKCYVDVTTSEIVLTHICKVIEWQTMLHSSSYVFSFRILSLFL